MSLTADAGRAARPRRVRRRSHPIPLCRPRLTGRRETQWASSPRVRRLRSCTRPRWCTTSSRRTGRRPTPPVRDRDKVGTTAWTAAPDRSTRTAPASSTATSPKLRQL